MPAAFARIRLLDRFELVCSSARLRHHELGDVGHGLRLQQERGVVVAEIARSGAALVVFFPDGARS